VHFFKQKLKKKIDSSTLNFKNLSVQLSLIAIGIPTLILILFEIYLVNAQTKSLQSDLDVFLKNEAAQLAASLSSSLFNLDDESSRQICNAALAKPQVLSIKIWDGDREYLTFKNSRYTREYAEKGTRQIEYPISFEQEILGKLRLVVTTVPMQEKIDQFKFSSLLQVVVVDLILGLVLFITLIIRFVYPLRELEKSSKIIAAGNLDQSLNIRRNDELGSLADNLVLMRDAVKEKVESLKAEVEQHRKTASALEQSESFLRLIIDLIPHMIFVKDKDGRFLIVNQAKAEDMNTSVNDVIGGVESDFADNQSQVQQHLKDDQIVIESKKTLTVLSESYGAETESSRWYVTKKVPFNSADGGVGIVGITTDISDLKHAELELKKTKKYIDNIIDSMPSALFSLDKKLSIVLWNHQAEHLFGIQASDALSQPMEDIIPEMKKYTQKIQRAMADRVPMYFSKQVRMRSSDEIYEDITIYPLTAGVEGVVIRVDDVTDQVRMEEIVVQSEKMLSIGGLAAGMAHEINNPLAGMMQNAQVIEQRIQKDIPASVAAAQEIGTTMDQIRAFMEKRGILKQLEMIRQAGTRASQIVQNMLSFSRKEIAGKSSQNIAQILDKTIELAKSDYDLKKQYDFKRIDITRTYDPSTPAVICEPSKIQQVFFNILKNSAQAMQEDESCTSPAFQLRIFPRKNMVHIEIEDNGPGMDKEAQKRIFEPFFTTKPVGKGTGLGMSVSYFIVVDNHNGDLQVVSTPGQGAVFIIQLPFV
jgi:PAS domain S-box-containing protein